MTNDPPPGSRPFPTVREGATDDDIFAEMSRMLAHDQFARPATAGERSQVPAGSEEAPGEDPPLELTEVIAPRQPPQAAATAPAPSAAGSAAAAEPPQPKETTVSAAVAMLDRQQEAAPHRSDVTVSTRPLDGLVEDLLRPMLQEWLDQNLERIVREHVSGLPNGIPPKT